MSEDLTRKLPTTNGATLDEILTTVRSLDTRVGIMDTRLGNLQQKVEERLHDTRPIWEKLEREFAQLQEGQQRLQEGQQLLQEGQEFLRGESREIRTILRDIYRKLSIFNDTLIAIQADYRDIYDRVREIERQRT